MLNKKCFGDYITVWSDDDVLKYGEVVSEVRIGWASIGSVSKEETLLFINNLFEAMNFAKDEEIRLGVNDEKD